MTLIELMVMHRKIFSIIDNLHDLCCKGTKDYKQALANVLDYNMTKIFTRKCSVPDKSGDIKESQCDFNCLFALQMDIELYCYLECVFRDYRSGKIAAEVYEKRDSKTKSKGEDLVVYVAGLRLHASMMFNPVTSAPAGIFYKRDNADVMNNFFINIVTRSYTNIEEYLLNLHENIESQKQKETLKELEGVKKTWAATIYSDVTQQFDTFDKTILELNKVYEKENKTNDTGNVGLTSQRSKGNVMDAIGSERSNQMEGGQYSSQKKASREELDDLVDL